MSQAEQKTIHKNAGTGKQGQNPIENVSGYIASFVIFTIITALWVFIVRDDDFYQTTKIFGYALPATTVFYLLTMPALGFLAGRWRFYQASVGLAGTAPRILARLLQFAYSHILIVLFTAAMLTETLLGWNIDDAVRELDDQLFDIASRFAPWLSAYLAGFNLGRATGLSAWLKSADHGSIIDSHPGTAFAAEGFADAQDDHEPALGDNHDAPHAAPTAHYGQRREPVFGDWGNTPANAAHEPEDAAPHPDHRGAQPPHHDHGIGSGSPHDVRTPSFHRLR